MKITNKANDWMLDGKINLTQICEKEEWHLASVVAALRGEGVPVTDAEAFAGFVFCDEATISDDRPEDHVTDEQYDRLTLFKVTQK